MTNKNEAFAPQLQEYQESLIKLSVLLYQIDGKVTLSEQDYFDEMVDNMEWRSGISKPAFINDAIHQARQAIDSNEASEFVRSLGDSLNLDAARTLEVAMELMHVDGERSEEEVDLLALLANRILARGLVA